MKLEEGGGRTTKKERLLVSCYVLSTMRVTDTSKTSISHEYYSALHTYTHTHVRARARARLVRFASRVTRNFRVPAVDPVSPPRSRRHRSPPEWQSSRLRVQAKLSGIINSSVEGESGGEIPDDPARSARARSGNSLKPRKSRKKKRRERSGHDAARCEGREERRRVAAGRESGRGRQGEEITSFEYTLHITGDF